MLHDDGCEKSERGIMFHDVVGLCIINFYSLSHLQHVAVTHTTRGKREENYFNLTSIMTEGQKCYFKQIRILIISCFLLLSRMGHPHVYEFSVVSAPRKKSLTLFPPLDRSAPDVNNSTYTCEVYLC